MDESKGITLESLEKTVTNGFDEMARMVANGFAQTATKDDVAILDKRLTKVEDGVTNLNARMGRVETRVEELDVKIEEIRVKVIPVDEFDDLSSRVKYVEKKLNIKSGR